MPSASAHSTPSYAFPSQPLLPVARSTVPIVWLLLMLNALITSATRQCYYPNGLAAANATPCLPSRPDTAEHSPCCRQPGLDGTCLAQTAGGLCLNQHATDSRAVVYVGGCTDPSMQDGACPSYCKSVALGESSVYAIVPCSDGTWCCSAADGDGIGDTACCSNADQTFRLDWAALLLSAQHHGAADESATAAEGHLTVQRLTRRDDTNSSSTSTTSSTSAASSSAIPLTLDDDDDAAADEKRQCPRDRSYIVGLSAGVPLGVCLLAALAAIFVLLNRDRKARERIRQMTEAAREERERAAQEHMIPRLYNPSTTKSTRFSHGSTVVTAGPPPHTPQQQQQQQEYGYQQPYDGYQHPYDGYGQPYGGYDGGAGVIYEEGAAGAAGPRHASMATSAEAGGGGGVKGGSHVSWATSAGRESSSWAYEYDGEPGSRKERFEMTP